MLRYLTAGDSHGPALLGIIDGLPAGLALSEDMLALDLARRQQGYGRGARQKIERDRARIMSGMFRGVTTGAPLGLLIENLDYPNWVEREIPVYSVPRPGHADYAGALKYGFDETRPISERASARETAMRVAIGAAARALLAEAGIQVYSRVTRIGSVELAGPACHELLDAADIAAQHSAAEASEVRCPDSDSSALMIAAIDAARQAGDTLGGTCEVFVTGAPVGLGSHAQWDRRLDARLSGAAVSIQSVKGAEIGPATAAAGWPGSEVQDVIDPGLEAQYGRIHSSNRAGGIEGGMSNGMPIVVRLHFKPIATLHRTLESLDLRSGEARKARYQRSDVCVVAPGSVVAEAAIAWVIAEALCEAYASDRMDWLLRDVELARREHAESRKGSGALPERQETEIESSQE
ncbi:chorismate synthase [bacterium]|nr:chorismate synthase [bacterium]